jgi:pimeloyl-ACP methyl ester carboxylesterase
MPALGHVASAGLRIAVTEYADDADPTGGPHVVLVHGYPDNQAMWRPVAERLRVAGMHVVTYDVRGAGASGVPTETAGYRTELLVDDLVAVVEATVPEGEPVHLVGHDWGAVQLWEAVLAERQHPRLRGRIASFTAISGPPLEHMGYLSRHPSGRRRRLLRQRAHSWYVYWFHLPALPELVWRRGHRLLTRLGARFDPGTRSGDEGGSLAEDAANGVNLYRANVRRKMRSGADGATRGRRTQVPVLVVAPLRDPFLTGVTVEGLDRICASVEVVRPDTGHWVPRTDPELVARLVEEQVAAQG